MIKVTGSTSVLGHCCSLAEQGPTGQGNKRSHNDGQPY